VLSSAAKIPRRFATIAWAVAANSVVFMRKSLVLSSVIQTRVE
jgi:hypothetical protein